MSATTTWYEQNGTAAGSPAAGTESTISSCDWKNIDDTTTPRASSPVLAGANSYSKYIYLKFTGTFNQISAVKFAHTAGTLGTGISLKGKITSTYATPSTASLSSSTDITSTTAIGSGASVLLGTTGPNDTSPSASQTTACYTQYIVTQVQTTSSANAGDSGSVTLTIQYNEN
jgi:hypothetical protein